MKPDIKWINKTKPRRTLSNISWKEDTVYPAHTLKAAGFSPYVNRATFLEAVNCIKQIHSTGDVAPAAEYLKELDQFDDSIFMDV